MRIRTTKVPIKVGNSVYKLHDIKVGCRFGIRLLIYFVLLIFTGPYFGNWTTTEKYFCRLDIFAKECSLSERMGPATDTFRCSAQRFKIAKLGSIIRVSVLTIGFVLGLILDILGPKLTFLLGILMRITSWLIFSIKSVGSATIILSSVILGLSRNAIAYPTLTIYVYTTTLKEYATTIMGIGITLAGLYIIVLERIISVTRADPYKFTLLSTLVTHIPCLVIGMIMFPWKTPPPKTKKKTGPNDSTETKAEDLQMSTDEIKVKTRIDEELGNKVYKLEEYSEELCDTSPVNTPERTIVRIGRSQNSSIDESDLEADGDLQTQIPTHDKQWSLKKFLKYLKSVEYLVTCPYFILNFMDFFFMQLMFSTMYGTYPDLLTTNEYLVSFSFVLTFLIGFLYRVFNPLTILILANFFGIVTHVASFNGSRLAGYIVAFTLITYSSILFTQTYIYIQSTFEAKYFGSLIGTINTLSGFVMFFNILLISLVEKYNCINHIHAAMIVARSVSEVTMILLNLKKRKRTKSI